MALNQHNLPVLLKPEISRLLSDISAKQDRALSEFGLLVLPQNTRKYRSFYSCYTEFVPVFQREWALRLVVTGTVFKRHWHFWHVLGCIKYADIPPITGLGGIHRNDLEYRLLDWQQHLFWLLEQTKTSTLICQPREVAKLLKKENIWVDMPKLIPGTGTDHLHQILAPVIPISA